MLKRARAFMIVTLAAVASFAAVRDGRAAERIEFGTTGRSDATSIVFYLAYDKKFFDAHGLAIDWIAAGSAARAAQQAVAGSLNICIAATDQTIRAVNQGANLKIVAGAVGAAPFRVLGAKTVAGWGDLKGKTISVGGASDQTLFFFRLMARQNKLGDKDYDLVYGGTTPARFAQLLTGAVGAAVLTNPQDIAAMNAGYKDLGAAPDYVPVWTQNNVYVNADWAQSHRAQVVAFIRSLQQAAAFFYDPANREETVAVMMKYTGSDRATAQRIYDFYVEKNIIAKGAALSNKGIEAVEQSLIQLGDLKETMPIDRLVDPSYLADANKADQDKK